jgi:hypothetical protein
MVRSNSCRSSMWRCRLSAALTVVLLLSAIHGLSLSSVASQEEIGVPLDLAAMALRPSDLEAAGLADYGVSLAIIGDAANAGGFLNAWRGDPNGETASGLFRAKPLRAHLSYLALSERIGDNSSPTARQILSYIIEFENVTAAQTGFPILADAWSINGTNEVPGGAGIGEEQIVVSLTGQQPDSFAGYDRIDHLFRTEALVAGISIENFTGDPPTVEEAERLSRQLLSRIDMVRAGNGPDLGSRAVRLSVPAWAQSWDADAYNIMNREGLRRYGESEESLVQYQAGIEADQVLDYYFIAQQLNRLTDGDYRSYFSGIRRFATPDAAATFLGDLNNRLERNNFTNITIDESVPTFGDTSTAITYQRQLGGQAIQGARITMQLGDLLASVELTGPEAPPMALLEQLMTVQLNCLTTDSCPISVPLPPELSV